jgi:hypothetical protein
MGANLLVAGVEKPASSPKFDGLLGRFFCKAGAILSASRRGFFIGTLPSGECEGCGVSIARGPPPTPTPALAGVVCEAPAIEFTGVAAGVDVVQRDDLEARRSDMRRPDSNFIDRTYRIEVARLLNCTT